MITPKQCRAARGLLDWTQQVLADKAQIGVVTLRQFESGANLPRRATLKAIEMALAEAGVLFVRDDDYAGAGVRMAKKAPK